MVAVCMFVRPFAQIVEEVVHLAVGLSYAAFLNGNLTRSGFHKHRELDDRIIT